MLTKFNLYQPAAIDNSLNSYQIIHKIIAKMNDVIDEINNIDSKANEYTDEQIRLLKAELQTKFDDIESEIVLLNGRIDLTNSNLTTLENAFNDFKTAITGSVNQLSINVAALSDYVAQTESMLINYINNKIDILTHLIESLQGVKVFGLNGKLTTVQDALNQIVRSLNMSRQFLTYKELITNLSDDAHFVDSSASPAISVRVGDITYKELIDGITRQAMSSLYLSKYFGTSVEQDVIKCTYINAYRRPLSFLVGGLACALSQHISSNTSYYGMCKAVTSRFNSTGIGYATILYDYSGRYS